MLHIVTWVYVLQSIHAILCPWHSVYVKNDELKTVVMKISAIKTEIKCINELAKCFANQCMCYNAYMYAYIVSMRLFYTILEFPQLDTFPLMLIEDVIYCPCCIYFLFYYEAITYIVHTPVYCFKMYDVDFCVWFASSMALTITYLYSCIYYIRGIVFFLNY